MRRALYIALVLTVGVAFVLLAGPVPTASALAPYPGPIAPLPSAPGTVILEGAGGSEEFGALLTGLGGVPAFAPLSTLGAVPVVGTAIGGLLIGDAVGNGLARSVGFTDDQVCAQQNGVLTAVAGVLNQVNCVSYDNQLTAEEKNADQALSGATGGKVCFAGDNTQCLQLVGIASPPIYTYANGNQAYEYCFAVTGTSGTSWHFYWADGSGSEYGVYIESDGPCSGYPAGSQVVIPSPSRTPSNITTLQAYGCSQNANGCGSAQTPVENTTANPKRELRCVLLGSDGNTYTGYSSTFYETDPTFPQPYCETLPSGVTPTHEQIWLVTVDGSTAPVLEYDSDPTGAYKGLVASYPDCAAGACQMQLYSADPTSPCKVGGVCADWFSDPNKSTDFTCYYGPSSNPTEYTLDISECYVLSKYYDPNSQSEGNAYTSPKSGLPIGGGVTTSPNGDQALQNQPATNENPDGSNAPCFPSGWAAFNPLNWVFQPIQCAFRWAFVPDSAQLKSNGLKLKKVVGASAVGSVIGILQGMTTFPITGNGCSGIPWNFHVYTLNVDANILAACPGDPLAATAATVKTVLTAVVITAGALASVRYVAQIFGYAGFGGIIDADRRQAYRDEARAARGGGGGGVSFG